MENGLSMYLSSEASNPSGIAFYVSNKVWPYYTEIYERTSHTSYSRSAA